MEVGCADDGCEDEEDECCETTRHECDEEGDREIGFPGFRFAGDKIVECFTHAEVEEGDEEGDERLEAEERAIRVWWKDVRVEGSHEHTCQACEADEECCFEECCSEAHTLTSWRERRISRTSSWRGSGGRTGFSRERRMSASATAWGSGVARNAAGKASRRGG